MAPPRTKQVRPGERYGRGVVIAEVTLTRRSKPWRGALLLCDCGTLYEAAIYDLLRSPDRYPTRSCGCLYKDRGRSQGLSRTHELYGTWSNMMARCYSPRFKQFKDYGGREIRVEERWRNPRLFIEDVEREIGSRPPGMTLDRIDNNSDYGPGKVKWSTQAEQVRNSRRYIDGNRRGPVYQLWWGLLHKRKGDVCERWQDFAVFSKDVATELGPNPGSCHFARLDSSRPYEPGNVAWLPGSHPGRSPQDAKLDTGKALEIKQRLAAGEEGCLIARDFGVSEATVSLIKSGQRWGKTGSPARVR